MKRDVAVALLMLSACRPGASGAESPDVHPTPPVVASSGEPRASATTKEEQPLLEGLSQTLSEEDEARRQAGLRALDNGRVTEAKQIFSELLARNRSNISLKALLQGAEYAEYVIRDGGAALLSQLPATRLESPPWQATLRAPARLAEMAPSLKLTRISERRNEITDNAKWFETNDLSLPMLALPGHGDARFKTVPEYVPHRYGELPIVAAIEHPDHLIILYGPDYGGATVLAVLEGERTIRALLDFESWRLAPVVARGDEAFVDQRIQWAQLVGDVLFVSTGHRTYAKSSGGQNAFISAIDLESGDLLWRSKPLVANAGNFVVRNGWIITGYGFTAEPDYLYVLDGRTGQVAQQLKIKTGPSHLVAKQDRLYVRTYDMDYVFRID